MFPAHHIMRRLLLTHAGGWCKQVMHVTGSLSLCVYSRSELVHAVAGPCERWITEALHQAAGGLSERSITLAALSVITMALHTAAPWSTSSSMTEEEHWHFINWANAMATLKCQVSHRRQKWSDGGHGDTAVTEGSGKLVDARLSILLFLTSWLQLSSSP